MLSDIFIQPLSISPQCTNKNTTVFNVTRIQFSHSLIRIKSKPIGYLKAHYSPTKYQILNCGYTPKSQDTVGWKWHLSETSPFPMVYWSKGFSRVKLWCWSPFMTKGSWCNSGYVSMWGHIWLFMPVIFNKIT